MELWEMMAWRSRYWADLPVVELPDQALTVNWGQLWGGAASLAEELREAGIGPGDRVAGRLQNGILPLQALLACLQLGAVWVPLNIRLADPALAGIVADAEPKIVLYDAAHQPISGVDIPHKLLPSYYPDQGKGAAARDARPPAQQLAYLLYTSGSTGRPKGVMLSHRAVLENTRRVGIELFVGEGETLVVNLPLYHVGALNVMWAFLYFGACAVIPPRYSAQVALDTLALHSKVSILEVPTTMGRLMDALGDGEVPESLHRVIYSGSPPSLGMLRQCVDRLGDRLIQFYGLTETSPTLTILRGHEHRDDRLLKSCGKPLREIFVAAWDAQHRPLPPGVQGELAVNTPAVMDGYWRNPEQTQAVLKDGWFLTGDSGTVDADGYVYIAGRHKEMIISGAENIYPKEVEDALSIHPAVREAAVVGIPDPEWGELVGAAVVTRSPVSAADLSQHCIALLGRFKRPRRWIFLSEMPVLETGKFDKAEIRRLLTAASTAAVD